MNRNFALWRLQSIADLRAYRKDVEGRIDELTSPLRKEIEEIDRLISAMGDGGELKDAITLRAPRRSPTSRKGFSYQGTHWTQRPENKGKLLATVLKGARNRGR